MSYTFLAHPPQKRAPSQPLPPTPFVPRHRSATFSAIHSWVNEVAPGTPAPKSPCSRRPSLSSSPRRRGSITTARVHSASFLQVDSPTSAVHHNKTPNTADYKPDLVSQGYNAIFVQLPPPPPTPVHAFAKNSPKSNTDGQKTLTRFRSLSALRPRKVTPTARPAMPPPPVPAAKSAATIIANKKTKYAFAAATTTKSKSAKHRPPPLANELALLQFQHGGSLEEHAERLMRRQARAAARAGDGAPINVHGAGVGVGVVHRDAAGGLWWDQDEEWEYAHLLGGEKDAAATMDWETFATSPPPGLTVPTPPPTEEERRGSVSTVDSQLDPSNLVKPADEMALALAVPRPSAAKQPILATTSRSRRPSPEGYVDTTTFTPIPKSPLPPMPTSSSGTSTMKPSRRRPAPLTLAGPAPTLKRACNSPMDTERTRKDFIEDSFAPPPIDTQLPVPARDETSLAARARKRMSLRPAAPSVPPPLAPLPSASVENAISKKPSRIAMLFRNKRD